MLGSSSLQICKLADFFVIIFSAMPPILFPLNHSRGWFAGLLALLCLAGWQTLAARPIGELLSPSGWTYADLRLLDPADASRPDLDILAAYMRRSADGDENRLELRLDFLDLDIHSSPSVVIMLDAKPDRMGSQPVGAAPATLIVSADGRIQGYDAGLEPIRGLAALVQRDPVMDTLEISIDATALVGVDQHAFPPVLHAQVFVTFPGSSLIADRTAAFTLGGSPPPPAFILLAFWNTYPAYTPAQALRRWDGAHTGPAGGRHGLSNLLRLARSHAVPLVLLDLKTPAWLSAMDYGGDLDLVEDLASSGLLMLPDVWLPQVGIDPHMFGDAAEYSVQLAGGFRLPPTYYAYAQTANYLPTGYNLAFLPAQSTQPLTSVYRWRSLRIIPIPIPYLEASPQLQPAQSGLSLEARRLLVSAALDTVHPAWVVLGGNLTRSAWGNPEAARQGFDYIAAHPWMQMIGYHDIISSPTLPADAQALDATSSFQTVGVPRPPSPPSLSDTDAGPLLEAALQSMLALASLPAGDDPRLGAVRSISAGQVNVLLAAAAWAQDPQPVSDCETDIDLDGKPDCVLASLMVYTVYDPDLGALTHAFALTPSGEHQWIAPSSQFTFDAGDPATWDPSLGLAADPGVIPGAFSDSSGSYQAEIEPGRLVFTSSSRGSVKTFTLLEVGLRIELIGAHGAALSLPLALDPWQRFSPGWGDLYQGSLTADGFNWGAPDGFALQVSSSAPLAASTFKDTEQLMGKVENPNTEYLPGHYLPFPLALLEITPGQELVLTFKLVR